MDEKPLPAQRMEHATTKLQDAMSALKLAAEELHIVDAEMIGSDANRRVTVEASKEDPIKVSDDIESHRMQAAEIAGLAAEVAKTAKVVKGKAAFLGQALGSVYSSELLEGDRAREKAKDKQAKLFPPGDHDADPDGSPASRGRTDFTKSLPERKAVFFEACRGIDRRE